MKQQNGKKLACSMLMLCTAVCYGLCSAGQQQRGARPQPPACVFARAAMLVCCLARRHCATSSDAAHRLLSPSCSRGRLRRRPPRAASLAPSRDACYMSSPLARRSHRRVARVWVLIF